jgi:uncharacterized protein YjbI with pentapeptide repeats
VPQCKYHEVCNRDVEGNSAEGLCILHSTDPAKDTHAFAEALAAHRQRKGDDFSRFFFPGRADFYRATFSEGADFRFATFSGEADFGSAMFNGMAFFGSARFTKKASFLEATFSEGADFRFVTFSGEADFGRARFTKEASFSVATFSEGADFGSVTFSGEADFGSAMFNEDASFAVTTFSQGANFGRALFIKEAEFHAATFSGKTLFTGGEIIPETGDHVFVLHIFAGIEVDFTEVVINQPDAMTFLGADLTKCQFQNTDLRKVQFVGVTWPRKRRRVVVYDEIVSAESEDKSTRPWAQIERLYRELKQNYEDRRDYERSGDFHYSEKEIRRQNPETATGLRFFLWLYWLFSGYGERYLRPLLWTGLLFAGSTIGYMWWGLRLKDGSSSLAWTYPWINPWDWLRSAYYSFRVMTLLKPDDWVPLRYAQLVNTFQTLLGPVFLGLFALALRQRLKR